VPHDADPGDAVPGDAVPDDAAAGSAPSAAGQPPRQLLVAVAVVAVEALALLLLALLLAAKALTGHPHSLVAALLAASMALVGALALALCARGLFAMRVAARTPVVVLQVLALPVGYDLSFQAGRVAYGGPMLLVAVMALYLLFTPPVRALLDRDV